MIQWFSSLSEFEQLTELYHKTHTAYFDTLCVSTAITFVELQAILPLPPDSNPFPSEPGPHEYWYCCIDDLPVLIAHYHTDARTYTTIRTFASDPNPGSYFWSPIRRLTALPKLLMQRIISVGWWKLKEQPVVSLYYYKASEEMNSSNELYQAETIVEAEALLIFLQSLQSEYTYYIDEPNLNTVQKL